ncbi:MAG: hypothetical protein JXB39_10625 [Deltaproteobacteria bacterium]|nr:hypothetical protein [Deltaproteobacteria bacterium]
MERLLRMMVPAVLLVLTGSASAQQDPVTPPAPTTPPVPTTPAAEEGDQEASGTEEFDRRLLTEEERVNSLKEQVFRAKATLQLLKEIMIQGSSSGARAVVWHENSLSGAFSIDSITYFLDGESIYAFGTGGTSQVLPQEFKLHEGPVPAGNHTIAVSMVLRGNGFGVFSYVDRYTFNVDSSYAFDVEEGRSCEVWVRLKERKGVGRSFVERPNVVYDLHCTPIGESE